MSEAQRRSERFVAREARELRKEVLVSPWPELGLVAFDSPYDPEPGLVVEAGRVVGIDGRRLDEFDVIVHFLARPTGQPLEEAPEERGEKIVGTRPRQRALPGARERGAGRGADPGGFRGLRVGHGGAAPRRSVLTPAASTFRDPPCPGACAAAHLRGSPREGACRAPAARARTLSTPRPARIAFRSPPRTRAAW